MTGLSAAALLQQGVLGLINGAFYALLSLGFAIVFGLLGIINFVHGSLFMLGAFTGWALLEYAGIGYFPALVLAPALIFCLGWVLERFLLRRLESLDPLYGLLLTFGLSLAIAGVVRNQYGSSGLPYPIPRVFVGATNLGFMFLPTYRLWVVAASALACLGVWIAIEKTRLGALLRAATENPRLVQAFGVDVPRLVGLTYAAGAALAAFAGVLAAPIYSVNPNMGEDFIVIVFAVVVIGGMGSIAGAVLAGFALGIVEGFAKVFYPEASATVIFVVMALVLLVRPQGLFGRAA